MFRVWIQFQTVLTSKCWQKLDLWTLLFQHHPYRQKNQISWPAPSLTCAPLHCLCDIGSSPAQAFQSEFRSNYERRGGGNIFELLPAIAASCKITNNWPSSSSCTATFLFRVWKPPPIKYEVQPNTDGIRNENKNKEERSKIILFDCTVVSFQHMLRCVGSIQTNWIWCLVVWVLLWGCKAVRWEEKGRETKFPLKTISSSIQVLVIWYRMVFILVLSVLKPTVSNVDSPETAE